MHWRLVKIVHDVNKHLSFFMQLGLYRLLLKIDNSTIKPIYCFKRTGIPRITRFFVSILFNLC